MSTDKKTAALEDLVRTIEATGGLVKKPGGLVAPAGDEEWTDLGDCYLRACDALGRPPAYVKCIDCDGTNIEEGACLDCMREDGYDVDEDEPVDDEG